MVEVPDFPHQSSILLKSSNRIDQQRLTTTCVVTQQKFALLDISCKWLSKFAIFLTHVHRGAVVHDCKVYDNGMISCERTQPS